MGEAPIFINCRTTNIPGALGVMDRSPIFSDPDMSTVEKTKWFKTTSTVC